MGERDEFSRRALAALERLATGVEKLAVDAEFAIEAGPPICPNCGKHDPEIILPNQEQARGPMSQLIVDATCTECAALIFITVESYSVHASRVTAVDEIKERESTGFFKAGGRENGRFQ
jgi:hypothetical protein